MMTTRESEALIEGASLSKPMSDTPFRAKITRGVYVRGIPYAEGAIVEVNAQELGTLIGSNYAVEAPAEAEAPKSVAKKKSTGE
jgi:hypothetical protein